MCLFSQHSSLVWSCRIPDSIGKDIEKACQSIYPLHDVFVRKVKMLKKPKFECKLQAEYAVNSGVTIRIKTKKPKNFGEMFLTASGHFLVVGLHSFLINEFLIKSLEMFAC